MLEMLASPNMGPLPLLVFGFDSKKIIVRKGKGEKTVSVQAI